MGEPGLVGGAGAFSVPEGTNLRALAARLAPDVPERGATLRVRSGRAVALRHRAEQVTPLDEGWERVQVRFGRLDRFVDEVVALGADVVVEEPADLREAVVRRLRAVLGANA